MPKQIVTRFGVIGEKFFIKCPNCKRKVLISPNQMTTKKHLVSELCWHCKQVIFKITFVSPVK